MVLEHHFKNNKADLKGLFDGVTKFSQFTYRLEKYAELDTDRYPRDQFLGDGFEFFAELFFKHFKDSPTIGVHEYHPLRGLDNGVDAYGINMNLKHCAFQIKYRSNGSQLLTAEDGLNSFMAESSIPVDKWGAIERVDYLRNKVAPTLFIFTSAKGLHWYTETVKFRGLVKVFGRKEIKQYVDDNLGFWKSINDIIDTLNLNTQQKVSK